MRRDAGVCVLSRYTFEQRLSYARNRPHVKNPEGFAASKRAAEGEFDEAISAWLAEQESSSLARRERDASGCLDCFGTGMFYPEGPDKGVARCRHPRLAEAGAESVPP